MKIDNRKYNFKSLESLMSCSSATKLTFTNDITVSSKNKSMSQSQTNKKFRKQSSVCSMKSYKPHKSCSVDYLFNSSFEKNQNQLEKHLKSIKKVRGFNKALFLSTTEAKGNLNARVKTLSTFINMRRIESTNMSLFKKGEMKEKAILTFKSNVSQRCHLIIIIRE